MNYYLTMKRLFPALLLLLILASCGEKEPFDEETKRLDLIDARDNTMPIITEMLNVRRDILMKVGNFNALDEDDQEVIKELGDEMNEANTALMQWISDFNKNIAKYMDMENGAPEQKKWMEEKEESLEDIVENIQDVIKDGQKIAKKF